MPTITRIPFLLLIALLLIAATAQAKDAPDWVINYGKSQKYPEGKYLVGFGSAAGKGPDAYQIAQDNARADLSRTIIVDIKSLLSTVTEENNQRFSQYLSSITQSSTSIQLMGLQTEPYVDEKNKTTYVLAYVSRADLKRIYSNKKSNLRHQIKRIIEEAQSDEQSSKVSGAVAKYLSLYPLYEELKEAETILLVANQSNSFDNAFDELEGETGKLHSDPSETPIMSKTEVTNKIEQLLSESIRSVEDVARSVVYKLSKQVGNPNGQVLITPLLKAKR